MISKVCFDIPGSKDNISLLVQFFRQMIYVINIKNVKKIDNDIYEKKERQDEEGNGYTN